MDEWITTTRQEEPQQAGQEEEMFGRKAREAREARRQQAEADRLLAEADRLDERIQTSPNYRRKITADRTARVMRQLGEALTPDARAQASGPELAGTELDAEIDRLAKEYPEPEGGAPDPLGWMTPDARAAYEAEAQAEPEAGR